MNNRGRWITRRSYRHSDTVRIGACADYLLGVAGKTIEHKWGIQDISLVTYWIKRTGSFKLRRPRSITR